MMHAWPAGRLLTFLLVLSLASCQRSLPPAAVTAATKGPVNAVKPAAAASRASYFHEGATEAGIDFTYRSGAEAELCTMLESLGGGVGWLDYDRDGQSDLIATGGGRFSSDKTISGLPAGLFRNAGAGSFSNVAASAGLEASSLYTNGLAVADYDDDGFADVLITGYGPPQLWHNLGDGTFEEVAIDAGITNSLWGSSAAWGDLNGDGSVDLYIAHYVNWSFTNDPYCQSDRPSIREICPPRSFDPLPHVVYYSQGDGTFADATAEAGLRPDGKGLGVMLCDVEPDGDLDIYVANDTTDNFLYVNDGQGRFSEQGLARGVALDDHGIPNGSMGIDLCDFNRDGLPDIWVANYERESFALYRNEGSGNFLHVSQRLGITDLGGLFVGFGTACEDFDADGDQDIVVVNGHVLKFPGLSARRQLPLLLEYDGDRFRRAPLGEDSYFGQPREGRGLAVADYDADGDLDVAISHLNEPLALLENRFQERNRWLSLDLVGTQSNRDAIGTRITLRTSAGDWTKQVIGGGSYESHSSRSVHFALPPSAQPLELIVHWPAGETQTIPAADLAGSYTLLEPVDDEATSDAGTGPRLFAKRVAR